MRNCKTYNVHGCIYQREESISMENISPKMQNQLAMLQQLQQQLQTVAAQKTQYEMAIRESRRAEEELKDVPEDAEIFVNVGSRRSRRLSLPLPRRSRPWSSG